MKIWILMLSVMVLTACQLFGRKEDLKKAENLVSQTYFIQGMTCGGCVLTVKMALNKSEKIKIETHRIEVGKATLQFKKNRYDASNTDCHVMHTIEKLTDFKVFLDAEYTKRACGS